MRINCLGFARIQDGDRYALLLNAGRLKYNGERILSPVGGSFEYTRFGRTALELLGARDFEGDRKQPPNRDLCFRVPDAHVQLVEQWFQRRIGRETHVAREVLEELGPQESKIVPKRRLKGILEQHVGFRRFDALTKRNAPEKMTAYLIQNSVISVGPKAMQLMLAAARLPVERRLLYFVTRKEIMAGRTREGTVIGEITRFMLP